ncbi:MAG: protein kinase domain-containing protein [Desulfobaccales bacterium]
MGPIVNNKLLIDNFYEYEVEKIKEGGMGIVLILKRLSNKVFYETVYLEKLAAKTFKDEFYLQDNKLLFERELNIWLNIADIQNTTKLIKLTYIKNKLYALMPYYEYNLRDILRDNKIIDLDRAKFAILSILSALYHVYRKYKIIHQDLKPENILANFDKNDRIHFYLSDWGLANIHKNYINNFQQKEWAPSTLIDIMSRAGTLPYMSPERFLPSQPSIKEDIYSLGMIFFELLIGYLPFDYQSEKPLELQIFERDYYHNAYLILRDKVSNKYLKLILKCINPDPKYRYNNYDTLIKEVV